MTPSTHRSKHSPVEARAELSARLRERRHEIEQAIMARAYAVSDPTGATDPEYLIGLHAAIGAALDYGLSTVELGEKRTSPVPIVLIAQARLAARQGVGLDIVLRRYLAGFTVLGDFLVREAERDGRFQGAALTRVVGSLAALFDRLLGTISEEHSRETQAYVVPPDAQRVKQVQRLLDGELVDTSEFAYDFGSYHLGAVARGPEAEGAIRRLSKALNSRLLLVCPLEDTVWAWLGTQRETDRERLKKSLALTWPRTVPLALGEKGEGKTGWRLTHKQAKAAFSFALRDPYQVVHYADVALVAAMSRDELLVASLRDLYLVPLAKERDGGLALRRTLRTYFATGRNGVSTAAALGISRQTVANRLRIIEERIGRPLTDCARDVEAALQFADETDP